MRLIIKNINKMLDKEYQQGRFVCTKADETPTAYRFQFCDHNWPSARYIWVEVSRSGHWNVIEQNWEYRLNYLRCPTHVVTAEWFESLTNVEYTFTEIFKGMV
jgi:hypothetical protein